MGLIEYYSEYGSYHHNVVNKWIHIIGVPLLLFTFNGMGEFMTVSDINPVLILTSLGLLYYLSLHLLSGLITGWD
jgi:uncharacterized membrane protein YGL010W